MEKEKKWTYWNFLSELIPEDIATRPEEEKLYFLQQWEGLTVTKNAQSPANHERTLAPDARQFYCEPT
jgi:hypothetical protein